VTPFDFSAAIAPPRIGVLGTGTSGCETIERMRRAGVPGAVFYDLDVRAPALDRGRVSALVGDVDLLFAIVHVGDRQAVTRAASIVNRVRETGGIAVVLAAAPFEFEGSFRERGAARDLVALARLPGALLVLPQQRLLSMFPAPPPRSVAYGLADDALLRIVEAVVGLIDRSILIGVDFADVRLVMEEPGPARAGWGMGRGPRRVRRALRAALAGPLLGARDLAAARALLVNVSIPTSFDMSEWSELSDAVHALTASDDVPVVMGCTRGTGSERELRVTILATGIGGK